MTANLRRWRGPRTPASPWDAGELIRAELFSVERLEEHASSLAMAQRVSDRSVGRRSLGARLRENESILLAAYRGMAATVAEGRVITPAAEWLLDNYHLVEDQIRPARESLDMLAGLGERCAGLAEPHEHSTLNTRP